MRISVYASHELQAVLLKLKTLDRDTRGQIRRGTKADAAPIWATEVGSRVQTRAEGLALGKTARVAVSDQNVQLQSARIGRALSGGLLPSRDYAALEFGTDHRDEPTTYESTSTKGQRFTVKRRTRRQLRSRAASGHVVYPAVGAAVPRLAALWVQTVVRTLHEALEAR